MLAGDGDVVEEDLAVRRAADDGALGLDRERLPRPTAARADDQGGALDAELVARLQKSGGRSVLDEVDVDRLTQILTGKAAPEA